jgi:predicted secreted acid phosphatase
MADSFPEKLGKYRIIAEVGRGGFAAVYKTVDTTLKRTVALKCLAPHLLWDPTFVQRFQREAEVAANLDHRNIVTIYEVGQIEGVYFIAMQFLEGRTLSQILKAEGPLPVSRVQAVIEQIGSALNYAHARGFVHRDIKPSNIIVADDGRATLTDFGLVKAGEGTQLTASGMVFGTPEYMSPEQAEGKVLDTRSDIYSLGVVLFEMLSGQAPFLADTTPAVMYKHVHTPPPLEKLPSNLPQGVVAVVEKTLAKDPTDRYQSAGQMVEALRKAAAEAPVPAEVAPSPLLPKEEAMPLWQKVLEGTRTLGALVAQRVSEWVQTLGALVARRMPSWAWALGALMVLATIAIAFYILRPKLGNAVLFTSDRDGKREVYRITSTEEAQQVTHTPGRGESWSPASASGGTVLFTSDRDGKREVYRITSTGEVQRVTHTPGRGESWSPASASGGTVLFTSDRDGKREVYRITSTGEVQQVTHTPGKGESWSPVSASGGTVLFASDRDGKREVYRITSTGEVQRVTHTPGRGESWSPASASGGTVLFTSDRDGKQEVYRITSAGEVQQVTHTPGKGESWSPVSASGGTVLFASDRDAKREVYRITSTGEVQQVTHTPGKGESWLLAW